MNDGLTIEHVARQRMMLIFAVMMRLVAYVGANVRTGSRIGVVMPIASAGFLPRQFQIAVRRLLFLALAASGQQSRVSVSCASLAHDDQPFEPPEIALREACELLNGQNIAARVAALNRELDDLQEQAGRLVRWRAQREDELADESGVFFRLMGPSGYLSDARADRLGRGQAVEGCEAVSIHEAVHFARWPDTS